MRPEIPQTRRPIEDEKLSPFNNLNDPNDSLKEFLTADSRWELLPSYFKFLVIMHSHDIHTLPPDELLERARYLDENGSDNSYLKEIKEKEGSLMMLHSSMTDVFQLQNEFPEDVQDAAADRVMRIFVAGRQIGKSMAEQLGWDPQNGFGTYSRQAHIAIDMCTRAVREIPPSARG